MNNLLVMCFLIEQKMLLLVDWLLFGREIFVSQLVTHWWQSIVSALIKLLPSFNWLLSCHFMSFQQPDSKRDWKNFCDYVKDKCSQLEMERTKVSFLPSIHNWIIPILKLGFSY